MPNRMLDTAASIVQDNPSVAAGTVTFAVAFALVAGNAFYAQSGTHPEPIWATRDATFTHSVEKSVRPVKTTIVAPTRTQIPVPEKRAEAPKPSELVASIQRALVTTGDFSGSVDGLMGPLTKGAIITYQKRNGFEQTGKPSKLLLSALETSLPSPARGKDTLSGLISDNATPKYDRDLVRAIQSGLADVGKTIAVDGVFGNRTRTAIEEFQREHGMKVTGTPDQTLLRKMKTL